jgi:beta-glucosidase-like glycosyl hydrolase
VSLLVDEIGKVELPFNVPRDMANHFALGFSPDPVLTGVAIGETIKGIQDAGVIANAKHYIMNEQEHNRDANGPIPAYSANVDDKTMHETYLWYVL